MVNKKSFTALDFGEIPHVYIHACMGNSGYSRAVKDVIRKDGAYTVFIV